MSSETRAACDTCDWEGASAAAASQHHKKTGHVTWAQTETLTFWGDPLNDQYLAAEGVLRTTNQSALAASTEGERHG